LDDLIVKLAAAIHRLCEADPAALADRDTIVALYRERERLRAVVTRASRVRLMTLLQQEQNAAWRRSRGDDNG